VTKVTVQWQNSLVSSGQLSRFLLVETENEETGEKEIHECSDKWMLELLLRNYGADGAMVAEVFWDLANRRRAKLRLP
jgi:hypothetical protein